MPKPFGEHKTKWITISLDEYESMQSTIEVLSDRELMEQLRESRKAKEEGRVKPIEEFAKELGIEPQRKRRRARKV